jgi:hypothetical protein
MITEWKHVGKNLAHTSIGEELELEICMACRMFVVVTIVLVVIVFPPKLDRKMVLRRFFRLWLESLRPDSNVVFVNGGESVVV